MDCFGDEGHDPGYRPRTFKVHESSNLISLVYSLRNRNELYSIRNNWTACNLMSYFV